MNLLAAIRQILGFTGPADTPPSTLVETRAVYDPEGQQAWPLAIAARGLIDDSGAVVTPSPGGTGTQLQARASDGTFQGIANTSWNGTALNLRGLSVDISGATTVLSGDVRYVTYAGNGALRNEGLWLSSDGTIAWNTGQAYPPSGEDLKLVRDTAGVLALRNGTNPQTLRVYGAYTDASNYRYAFIKGTSGGIRIGAEGAGTGAGGDVYIDQAGVQAVYIDGTNISFSRGVMFSTDNTCDIGASGANRPRDIYAAGKIEGQLSTTVPVLDGSVSPTHYFHIMTPSGTALRVPCEVIA
jgi:hypothetical protein